MAMTRSSRTRIVLSCGVLVFAGLSTSVPPNAQSAFKSPDINDDGIVDTNDVNAVSAAFGRRCGSSAYNAAVDVNADCVVNTVDHTFVFRNIGKTFPIVSIAATPPPNAAGWNNTNVLVTVTCQRVASCPAPMTVSAEGAGQVITLTARDLAGRDVPVSVTLNIDKTPPSVAFVSPADAALLAVRPIPIRATATDGLSGVQEVTCGGRAATQNQSEFECSADLEDGLRVLEVTATDVAGNSATAAVSVTVDTTPPRITILQPASGAVITTPTTIVSGTVSEPATVRVNGAPVPTTQLAFSLANVAVAAGANEFTVTATDPAGNTGTTSVTVTGNFSLPGQSTGFIRGEVYDDSKGLPLGAPRVSLLRAGGAALAAPMTVVGDGRGQFVVEAAEGDALLEIAADDFTSVFRSATTPDGVAIKMLDARLTPLDAGSASISSALGGIAGASGDAALLTFPPGSVAADTSVRVTSLSGQGLPARLPLGWSPVAAVDVRPLETALAQTAVWQVPNTSQIVRGRQLVLARFDVGSHRWLTRGEARVSSDGRFVEAEIDRLGRWAIVAPDAAPFTPPNPAVGQALEGVGEQPLSPGTTANGSVDPQSAPPGERARAMGELKVQSPESVPSGTRVAGVVTQRFDLRSGSAVVPLPFTQDLLLYSDPRNGSVGELRSVFPVTPSRNFTFQELLLGRVQVDITPPEPDLGGTLTGIEGNVLSDGTGATLTIPVGTLATRTVVDLFPLARTQLAAPVPDSLEFLGAVRFDLVGVTLSRSAILTFPLPAGLPADAQLLLAQVFYDFLGTPRLRVVARGVVNGTRIVTTTVVGDADLPGVVSGGQYALVRSTVPLAFATGTTLAPGGGTPLSLALVTADTAPFADLTATDGRYLTGIAVAAPTVLAASDLPGNSGTAGANASAANEVVRVDLTLATTLPTVISTLPAGGATRVALDAGIRVQFSKAMAPASVTAASVALRAGTVDVAGQRSLAADGRTLMFLPSGALKSATAYTLSLTGDLRDLAGNALAPFTPLQFTTVDTSRDTTLAPGQITARLPDEDGIVMVTGTPGTAEASAFVAAVNQRTQESMTVLAKEDGSFRLRITARLGDVITLRFRNAAGRETDSLITQFEDPDGTTAIGASGGTVRGGTRTATVLPKALVVAGKFRLTDPSGSTLPALPDGQSVADRFALSLELAEFNRVASLTLTESQGRFQPGSSSAFPFASSASLTVPTDFLIGGTLKFRVSVQDAAGDRANIDGATQVVSADPLVAPVETSRADRFPTVFLRAPKQALPNQVVEASTIAPTARVDFSLPAPVGNGVVDYLLVRATEIGGEARLAIADRLAVRTTTAGARLETMGRELPGATGGGDYVVVGSTTPFVFVTGRLTGPALVVALDGSPYVFEASGPNAAFILPVPANLTFTLRFLDPATGIQVGTATGQSGGSGTVDVGEPLGTSAGTMTMSAQPDETWVVDIDMPVTLTFSEAVDTGSVTSSTVVVTDAAGSRVYGRFSFSSDAKQVTFTPSRRWRYGQTYRYGVSRNVLAASGARLATPYSRQFTTFAPKILSTTALGEEVRDVAVSGSVGVVAGASGLTVLDLSDVLHPGIGAKVARTGGSSGVALIPSASFTDRNGQPVSGLVAVSSSGSGSTAGGLSVVSLSTPATPQVLGGAALTTAGAGVPARIALDASNHAYVAVDGAGAAAVDLAQSIPADPTNTSRGVLARSAAGLLSSAKDVAVLKDKLLVVGDAGLTILNAQTLERLGAAPGADPAVAVDALADYDLDINGDGTITPATEHINLAVVAGGTDGTLRFYDVTDATAVKLVGVVRLAGQALDVSIGSAEQLAYVAGGTAGLEIVDLRGPASVQPIGQNFDGLDDRLLATSALEGLSNRIATHQGRLALVASDTQTRIVQLRPATARLLTLLRDPVEEVSGDEQPLSNGSVAYVTDDAILVTVDNESLTGEVFLTLEQIPGASLQLRGGRDVLPLSGGVATIELVGLDGAGPSPSRATLRVVDANGSVCDLFTLTLKLADATATVLESMYGGPRPVKLSPGQSSRQLGIGGRFGDGRNLNLTRASSGTSYSTSNGHVATIDSEGLVVAVAGGVAVVTATNSQRSLAVRVSVDAPPALTDLTFEQTYYLLDAPAQRTQLRVLGVYTDGHQEEVNPVGIVFHSSDTLVATVDADGYLVAVNEGDTQISATIGGLEASASVGVEFATVPQITGIDLLPFALDVTSGRGTALAQVRLTGVGTLAGVPVTLSIGSGATPLTVSADYSGAANATLSGLSEPGDFQVTASVLEGAETVTDTELLHVRLSDVDREDQDAPVSLRLNGEVSGTVGDTDVEDTYQLVVRFAGELRVDVTPGTVNGATITASVRASSGQDVQRLQVSNRSATLIAPVQPGVWTLRIASTQRSEYKLHTEFRQKPLTVSSISPASGGPGTTVTITGTGFGNTPEQVDVLFGGVPGALQSVTDSTISVRVPGLAVDGVVRVVAGEQDALAGQFSAGVPGPALAISLSEPPPFVARRHPSTGLSVRMSVLRVHAKPLATREEVDRLVRTVGGRICQIVPLDNLYRIGLPDIQGFAPLEAVRRTLASDALVESVELEPIVTTASGGFDNSLLRTVNGFASASPDIAYEIVKARDAIEYAWRQRGGPELSGLRFVDVNVLDTGFAPGPGSPDEDFLISYVESGRGARLRLDNQVGTWPASSQFRDGNGHGTTVASVIGATNNGLGMNGILGGLYLNFGLDVFEVAELASACDRTDCPLDNGKIESALINIINKVNASPSVPHVVNLSIQPIVCYIRPWARRNPHVLFVAAAGNLNRDASWEEEFPCNEDNPPNLLVVGATGAGDQDTTGEREAGRALFTTNKNVIRASDCSSWPRNGSNCGNAISIVAPGEDVLVRRPEGLTETGGTSFAAPLVAATAGLLFATSPSLLSPADVARLITRSGTDVTASWKAGTNGQLNSNEDRFRAPGRTLTRLNALAAVRMLFGGFEYPRVILTDARELSGVSGEGASVASFAVSPNGTPQWSPIGPQLADVAPRDSRLVPYIPLQRASDRRLQFGIFTTGPRSVALSPKGDRAYITVDAPVQRRSGIVVVDTGTLEALKFIDLAGGEAVECPTPCDGFQGLRNNPRDRVESIGRQALAVSPDGKLLFIATTDGLRLINLEKGSEKLVESYDDLPLDDNSAVTGTSDPFKARLEFLSWLLRFEKRGPVALSLSADGRTLLLSTVSSEPRRRPDVWLINVDVTRDAAPETEGRQVDLLNFVSGFSRAEMPDLSQKFIIPADAPKAIRASPGGEHVYVLHGGGSFVPSFPSPQELDALVVQEIAAGGSGVISPGDIQSQMRAELNRLLDGGYTLLKAAGIMGVFDRKEVAPHLETGDVFSSGILGSSRRLPLPSSEPVYAKKPSAFAINQDGTQAVVSFMATGNFGVLDLKVQQLVSPRRDANSGWNGGSLAETAFQGYVGVTPSIRLDHHLWPLSPADLPRMYPIDVTFAQNGRFAVAAHVGTSGHEDVDCEANASDAACSQRGGVSLISTASMTCDLKNYAAEREEREGRPTSFFSAEPLCGAIPFDPTTTDLMSACGARNRAEPTMFTSSLKLNDGQDRAFVAPQGVAVQPIVVVAAPAWGSEVWRFSEIQVTWKQVPEALAEAVMFELRPRNGGNSIKSKKFVLTPDETTARTSQHRLDEVVGDQHVGPGWYELRANVFTSSGNCTTDHAMSCIGQTDDGCLLSSALVQFELKD